MRTTNERRRRWAANALALAEGLPDLADRDTLLEIAKEHLQAIVKWLRICKFALKHDLHQNPRRRPGCQGEGRRRGDRLRGDYVRTHVEMPRSA